MSVIFTVKRSDMKKDQWNLTLKYFNMFEKFHK